MYCGRLWTSMGIAEDNAYSLAISPVYCYHNRLLLPNLQIYCRRRHPSTDTFHSQSIVPSNVHGVVFPLVHCGSNIWFYTIVGSIVSVHVLSERLLFPPPTRIFPIPGCGAGCAIRNDSGNADLNEETTLVRLTFSECYSSSVIDLLQIHHSVLQGERIFSIQLFRRIWPAHVFCKA